MDSHIVGGEWLTSIDFVLQRADQEVFARHLRMLVEIVAKSIREPLGTRICVIGFSTGYI
ncbi:MAG TPA: hypothetical protein VHK01_13340 [Lacipirellulaceae bacterium]|jgi:hypothetical protein|nr:hypothetical protein [Lacipirellulaceae bacterium]